MDLEDRTKPMSELDVGRMQWACEVLDETRKFGKLSQDIVVRGDFLSGDTWKSAALRRVDVDAEFDAVCLSIYWHKPQNVQDEHPRKNLCRDLIFSAQRVGQGLELEIDRFTRWMRTRKNR